MFRQILSETPLYNDIANDFFTNIEGESYNGDVTFLSTMRMLLHQRMKADDRIYIEFHNLSKSKRSIETHSVAELLDDAFCFDYLSMGRCAVISLTGDDEGNTAFLQKIKTETPNGWQTVEKVEVFFKKVFSTVCMVNPTNKNFIVFVANLDIRKYHYLQSGILAFVPWYFDTEQGISEDEMALVYSLREKTPEKYEACLAEYAKQLDFRTLRIQKLLAGFESRAAKTDLKRLEREVAETIVKINDLNDQIAAHLAVNAERNIKIRGLLSKIADGDKSELMDYFLSNKNLVLVSANDTGIVFETIGYVSYFDEDEAERCISNMDSYIYYPDGETHKNIIANEDIKALMTAIFVDRKLKMKFCSSYLLSLRGNVQSNKHYEYSVDCEGCTPNPHIDEFACMGDYTRIINELLVEQNYIGAIEQCIASTVSLNFSDIYVMREFMQRIYGISDSKVNMRCIELPDGRVVEPKEAIGYLKSLNSQEGESENG